MLLGHELAEILLNFTLNRSDLDPARCWSLENGRPFIGRWSRSGLETGDGSRRLRIAPHRFRHTFATALVETSA